MTNHAPVLSILTSQIQQQATPWQIQLSYEALLQIIQQDLSRLLNYRRMPLMLSPAWRELPCSLLTYGLPDLSYFTPQSEQDRQLLRKLLQRTISHFERRLKNIYIVEKKVEQLTTDIYFYIHAQLAIVEEDRPVCFDSLIQPAADRIFVKQSRQEEV